MVACSMYVCDVHFLLIWLLSTKNYSINNLIKVWHWIDQIIFRADLEIFNFEICCPKIFGRSPLLVSCCGGTRRAKNEYFPTLQGRKVLVFCSTSHGTTSWSAGNTTRRQTPTNVPHSPGACPTRVPRCSCCQNDCWWPDCRDLGPFRTTSRHRWWSSSGGTRIQSR